MIKVYSASDEFNLIDRKIQILNNFPLLPSKALVTKIRKCCDGLVALG